MSNTIFGLNPESYDSARPEYPDSIYSFLVEQSALAAERSTLEIGAGSGLATKRLLMLGANPVVAIEPDRRFAQLLGAISASYSPRLQLIYQPFEDTDLAPGSFDLVVSATSFHWLDAEVRVKLIAEALKPRGYVALWWNVFQDLTKSDAFHEATRELLASMKDSPSGSPSGVPFALRRSEREAEFISYGFEIIGYQETHWTLMLNTEQVGSLYESFSSVQRLPDAKRAELLEKLMEIAATRFGGTVERNMTSPLYLFRRGEN